MRTVFSSTNKRSVFTNSELDRAIELEGLSFNELKKIAKKRVIKNIDSSTEDQLYHNLITTNRSPLENNFIEFMNKNFRSEVKERINHVLFLMTKLENKITNKERKEITSKLKDFLKEYVESRKRKVYKKIE